MLRVNIDIHESIVEWLAPADFYSFRACIPVSQAAFWAATPATDIVDAALVARAPAVVNWVYTEYPIPVTREVYQDILRNDYASLAVFLYRNDDHINYDVIRLGSIGIKEALVRSKQWNANNFERFVFMHAPLDARALARHCQLCGCAIDLYASSIADFPPDLIQYFTPTNTLMTAWISEQAWDKLAKTYDYYPDILLRFLCKNTLWYIKYIRPLVSVATALDRDCRALYCALWQLTDTLQTLNNLKYLRMLGYQNGELRDYLPAALASPFYEFTDYLIVNGMTINKTDFLHTKNTDAASTLYYGWVIQYLEPILMILILCLMIIIFPKIEKKTIKYNASTNRL